MENRETPNTRWVIRIGTFTMSVAIMVSSWFLNQAWGRIGTIETSVHELQLTAASTSGNKFTSGDWVKSKTVLDTERLALDRRLIRVEETIPIIKESLEDIKDMLRTH